MIGAGKMRKDWNTALLKFLVGPAYAHLMKEASKKMSYENFLKLYPTHMPPEVCLFPTLLFER